MVMYFFPYTAIEVIGKMKAIVEFMLSYVFWQIKRIASPDEALSFNRLFDSINLFKTIPFLED